MRKIYGDVSIATMVSLRIWDAIIGEYYAFKSLQICKDFHLILIWECEIPRFNQIWRKEKEERRRRASWLIREWMCCRAFTDFQLYRSRELIRSRTTGWLGSDRIEENKRWFSGLINEYIIQLNLALLTVEMTRTKYCVRTTLGSVWEFGLFWARLD